MRSRIRVLISILFLWSLALTAEEMAPRHRAEAWTAHQTTTVPRALAARESVRIDVDLPPMTADVFDAGDGNAPPRVGTVRELPRRIGADAAGVAETADVMVRTYRSAGAQRVRLRLDAKGATATTMWVYGRSGDAIPFGLELASADGTLWTPSVEGDVITIESRLEPNAVLHLVEPVTEDDWCLVAAECVSFPNSLAQSRSVAQLVYVKGSSAYICTGGLIVDRPNKDRLFLTANHCISTSAEAASVEATWDYANSFCLSGDYNSRRKRTLGASLLVTSPVSDVTLLRMTSIPSDRWWMGWNTAAMPNGTLLRRISHPAAPVGVYPQAYSATTIATTSPTCTSLGRPQFLYSQRSVGGIGPGSSGSPTVTDAGQIVGQLYGICGPVDDGCSSLNYVVDGAFAASFPLLRPYLDPDTSTSCSCSANATTACLIDGRFKVQLNWFTSFGPPQSGTGKIIRFTENRPDTNPQYGTMTENVFFSMYDHAPNAVEAVVRIFRGVAINDKWWVMLTGFSDTGYTVTVTDTRTCQTWSKTNPHGQVTIARDLAAFPFP